MCSWRSGGKLLLVVFPTFTIAFLVLKGHIMTTTELRALKLELKRLNVELNEFKGDILTERARELEQIICKRTKRLHPPKCGITAPINRDIN